MIALLSLIGLWLFGDFSYNQVIAYRIRKWESTVERDHDGVRIGCREFSLGEGETALLLIHGINDSPEAYRKMAPRLADQGFHVRAMRLPGFGETMDRYAKSTAADWKQAVGAEVTELRKRHDQVLIVAHSLGGAITIDFMLDNPGAVDGVALLAPANGISNARSPILPTRAWHTIAGRLLWFTAITESPFGRDARDPEERSSEFRTPFTARSTIDQTFALIDRNNERVESFNAPLLIAFSKDDQVNSYHASKKFFRSVGSKHKKWVDVENAGHQLSVDYGWEDLADQIVKFFRDVKSRDVKSRDVKR